VTAKSNPISILRIWNIIKKVWFIAILLVAIGGACGYYYTMKNRRPSYRATATIFADYLDPVVSSDTNPFSTQKATTLPNIVAGQRTSLMSDCIEISRIDKVIDATNEELEKAGYGRISAGNVFVVQKESNLKYADVYITASDPNLAQAAIPKYCEAFNKVSMEIVRIDNMKIINQSRAPAMILESPKKKTMIGAGIGFAIFAAIVFLMNMLDRTIRSEESFSSMFPKVQIVGTIPHFDINKERRLAKRWMSRQRQLYDSYNDRY
jgi:capsular polysaccharide biosynthesis protein